MFTIDQVTAVEAFFRIAGFDGQLRVVEPEHAHQITFVFKRESLRALRRKAGKDLEHVVQQILDVDVLIASEDRPWNATREFESSANLSSERTPAAQADTTITATDSPVTRSLTLDEAFRAAFFMIDRYVSVESQPSEDLVLLHQYMLSDPARWDDWVKSVERGLADPTAASEYLHDWRFRFAPPKDFERP